QGEMKYDTENYIEYPDRVRVVTQAPGGTVVQAFDGTRLWMVNPDGVHDAPEPLVRQFKTNLRRDPVRLLIGAEDGALNARLLPEQKTAEGALMIPIELSATDLNPVVLYIERDTALIRKQSFASDAPGRPLVEEVFNDYRT